MFDRDQFSPDGKCEYLGKECCFASWGAQFSQQQFQEPVGLTAAWEMLG